MSEANPSDVEVLAEAVKILGNNASGVNEAVLELAQAQTDLAESQRNVVVSQGKTRKVLMAIVGALTLTVVLLAFIIGLLVQSRTRGIETRQTGKSTAEVVSRIDQCLNGTDTNCYASVADAAGTVSVAKLVSVLPCFADKTDTPEHQLVCTESKLNYDIDGNGVIGG